MAALVLRSGGLGDFLLTLPLLRALAPVTLVTRRAYAQLIADDGLVERWLDIDSSQIASLFGKPDPALCEVVAGQQVVSFLDDPVLKRNLATLGAASIKICASRPTSPPHVTARLLQSAGLIVPDDLLTTSFLSCGEPGGQALWLHPGSGSPAKNAPHEWYRDQAQSAGEVIVSFGEADLALLPRWEEVPCERLICPALPELRRQLARRAGRFIGNDTGVTHLAAALGIPTTAVFLATDPAIWQPLGRAVEIVRY